MGDANYILENGTVVRYSKIMILKVARLGNPVLRRPASTVLPDELASYPMQQFIDDLIATMVEYDGAGLAAPQVHVSKQIVVFAVQGNPRYPDAPEIPLTVLVNPCITPRSDATEEDWEGCLSLPDLRGRVPRFTAVRVEALDRHGNPLRIEARDFHARVIQHECDHLQGKVFLDRMRSMDSLSFLREFVRYADDDAAVH